MFENDNYEGMLEISHDEQMSDVEYEDILGREVSELGDLTEFGDDNEPNNVPPKAKRKNITKKPVKKPLKKRPITTPEKAEDEKPEQSHSVSEQIHETDYDVFYEDDIPTTNIATATYGGDMAQFNNIENGEAASSTTDETYSSMNGKEFFERFSKPQSANRIYDDDLGTTEIPLDRQKGHVEAVIQTSSGTEIGNGEVFLKGGEKIMPEEISFNSYKEKCIDNSVYDSLYQKTGQSFNPYGNATHYDTQDIGMPEDTIVTMTTKQYKVSRGVENISINPDGTSTVGSHEQNQIESVVQYERMRESLKNASQTVTHAISGQKQEPVGKTYDSKKEKEEKNHVLDPEKQVLGQTDNLSQKAEYQDLTDKREFDSKAVRYFRHTISDNSAKNFIVGAGLAITGMITQNADERDGCVTVSRKTKEIAHGFIGQSLAYFGARSNLQAFQNHDKEVAYQTKRVSDLIRDNKLDLDDLKQRSSLEDKLKEAGVHFQNSILRNRENIAEILSAKESFIQRQARNQNAFTEKQMEFINSDKFFNTKNSGAIKDISMTYLHGSSNITLRALDGSVSVNRLRELIKNSDNFGITAKEKVILNRLLKAKLKEKYHSLAKMKYSSLRKTLTDKIIRADENISTGINFIRTTIRTGRTSLKFAKFAVTTGRLGIHIVGKVTGLSYLKRVATRAIKSKAKQIKNVAKGKIKNAQVTKKSSQTIKSAKEHAKNSKAGRTLKQAQNTVHSVKQRIGSTKPVQTAKKTVKATKKAAKVTAHAGSKLKNILAAPLTALGKVFSLIGKVRMIAILAVILPILTVVSTYLTILFGNMIVITLLESIAVAGKSVIFVDDYDDLKNWAHNIQLEDTKRYEEAIEAGEGTPIDPEVLEGHYIKKYGSPDKEKGYTIHYVDAYGNEIANKTTNAKDILCMAAVMFENDISTHEDEYYELVMDLYALMNPEIEYKESEIYTCLHGCDKYSYCCDCEEDYLLYEKYIADGCGKYEEMIPYNEDACEIEIEMVDIDEIDTSEWEEEDFFDENGDPILEVEVEKGHCPGHETPICYGHKDLDIYITIIDKEYAYQENLYPEDWQSKSYAPYIQKWFENGMWNYDEHRNWCDSLYDTNWFDEYGFDIEGGAGFTVGETLSNREIAEIERNFDGDVSEARKEVVTYALNYVGMIPYYWGGKANSKDYGENGFGSSIKADYKGRSQKGLDCSGFVQWVYWSVLDDKLPGSTAGYAGQYSRIGHSSLQIGDLGFADVPGAKVNHVGIYAGQDEEGNDLWVHCNSSAGNVSYNQTNCFHYYLKVLP